MEIVSRDQLIVGKRQRTSIPTSHINSLRESILARGLLNPPVFCRLPDGKLLLIAGECRLKTIDKMWEKGDEVFSCNGRMVLNGEYPILLSDLETTDQRMEAEYDENALREPLDWQDKTRALAQIHEMRLAHNPKQTITSTAKEVLSTPLLGTVKDLSHVRERIHEARTIVEHLNDPTIANARNATEAYTLVIKKQNEEATAALAKRRIAKMTVGSNPLEVRHGDMLEILPLLDEGTFDLILTDPPYGIDGGAGGFRARTVHHHNYDDDVDTARALAKSILTEGFRLTKPLANLFMFTDIKHWEWLQTISAQIGWTPFRRPIIWGKSDMEGLAPWGSKGPRITTEFILYCTKGQKGLLSSPVDYLRVNRVSRSERIHAAEKPVELLRKLIECSTLPGDRLLDPCCGSGSSLVAAKETKRFALGIEKDQNYFTTAMANVHGEA